MTNIIDNGTLRIAQLKMLEMLKFVDKVCSEYHLDYWLEGGTLLGAVRHQGFIPWDDDLDISMPRNSFNRFLELAPSLLPENLWLQTAKTERGYFNLSVPLKIRENNSRYIAKREVGLEPYHQGIYIDIFPYDYIPQTAFKRKLYKTLAKKIQRTLFHKYSEAYLYFGHYGSLYRKISKILPKSGLERALEFLIIRANKRPRMYLGYGYDCINNRYLPYEDFYPISRLRFEDAEFNVPNNCDKILRQQFGEYWNLPPKHKRGLKHCQELIAQID